MRLELLIDGMVAVHAKHAAFTALGALDGLSSADIELGRAVIELDPAPADPPRRAIEEALAAAGLVLRELRQLPRILPTMEP